MVLFFSSVHPSAIPFFLISVAYNGARFTLPSNHQSVNKSYTIRSLFGSCSTRNPNCFSLDATLVGRGAGWTATTEARLKADLAEGLGTVAIAKKHGWHMVSVQRAIRKVRSGARKCELLLRTTSSTCETWEGSGTGEMARVLTCKASCSPMKSSSVLGRMTGSNGCGWTA